MKIRDLLHTLVDVIADTGSEAHAASAIMQAASQEEPQLTVSADDSEAEPNSSFLPPLQAKIELLKKSVGIPSEYDNGDGDDLSQIRKLAGVAAHQEAGEDEPLDI
jgi:hypothetical protein